MPTPTLAGASLKGLCPRCGASGLFAGPVNFAECCRACALDFQAYDVGDGPAAFLILIVGAVLAVSAIVVDQSFSPPWWVHIIWLPVGIVLTVGGLRIGKAALLFQLYRHQAREGADRQMSLRRLPLIPTILVVAAVLTMIALGIWQISRAEEKQAMLARHAAAQGLPEIAFPTMPTKGELPLYRRASGLCIRVVGWNATAGADRNGEPGYSHFADCTTGAEGPGMVVDAGWSKDPSARAKWTGGKVTGVISPDRKARLRLVSGEGLGGLQASAPPSPASIPNNHLFYAVQWFFFAAAAAVIYALALRKRLHGEDPR